MESSGADRTSAPKQPAEWDRLELVIRRLLDDHGRWRRRALAAEAKVQEVEASLAQLTEGDIDPRELAAMVERLESEKRDLERRLDRARGQVGNILTRLELLEDER
jgi:predicted nuclease with TOPRIM domain